MSPSTAYVLSVVGLRSLNRKIMFTEAAKDCINFLLYHKDPFPHNEHIPNPHYKLSLSLSLSLSIYIYRERDRERGGGDVA